VATDAVPVLGVTLPVSDVVALDVVESLPVEVNVTDNIDCDAVVVALRDKLIV
jgi:hypothetical protein